MMVAFVPIVIYVSVRRLLLARRILVGCQVAPGTLSRRRSGVVPMAPGLFLFGDTV